MVVRLLFFFLLTFIYSPAIASERLLFLVEDDCPYACNPDIEVGAGFIKDILSEIFEDQGYDVHYNTVPWSRSLHEFNMSEGDQISGIIGMKEHPIDPSKALFPNTEIAQYTHAFYINRNSEFDSTWNYSGINSLKDITLAVAAGWAYCNKALTEYVQTEDYPNVQRMNGNYPAARNIKMLMLNRVDVWLSNQYTADHLISKMIEAGKLEPNHIVKQQEVPIDTDVNVYPIFYDNPKGRKLAAIFDCGIRQLRETGKLEKILEQYGLKDWVD